MVWQMGIAVRVGTSAGKKDVLLSFNLGFYLYNFYLLVRHVILRGKIGAGGGAGNICFPRPGGDPLSFRLGERSGTLVRHAGSEHSVDHRRGCGSVLHLDLHSPGPQSEGPFG